MTRFSTISQRCFAIALLPLGLLPIHAQDAEEVQELEAFVAEETVPDPIGILPDMPLESVFGIGLKASETPRSISVVTDEMIDRYGINSVNDVVAVTAGAFTNSFFGIDGAINLRGTIAETYFRGIKRIENPGNYPTPIGASQRIDVVRGPAPPTYGIGKISGYVNFIPKSARATTGKYLDGVSGEVTATVGSWDSYQLEVDLRGPLDIGNVEGGYYTYFQFLDEGSFYDNGYREEYVLQASFNFDLAENLRIEFGGMYQNFEGTENAGWNRLTQDLIDDSTYLRGRGQDFDTDGDGYISGRELYAADPNTAGDEGAPGVFFQPLYRFVSVNAGTPDGAFFFGSPPAEAGLDPADPLFGTTTTLAMNETFIDPDNDIGEAEPILLYFDLIADLGIDLTLTNQTYFEALPDRYKFASYGISQLMDVWVLENKTTLNQSLDFGSVKFDNQYVFSIRHYDVLSFGDYWFEFFDRRDLSQGPSSRDRILTSYQNNTESPWTSEEQGEITTTGFGIISNITLGPRAKLLLGGRVDSVEAQTVGFSFNDTALNAQTNGNLDALPAGSFQSERQEATSFNASFSYEIIDGVIPYVTYALAESLNTDQAGLLNVSTYPNILNEQRLFEVGVKAELLEGKFFGTVAYFEQDTVGFVASDRQENPSAATQGVEIELRYVPNENFSLIATAAALNVENTPPTISQFNFFGAPALEGAFLLTPFGPTDFYGGQITGNVDGPALPEKPQVPELVWSVVGTYQLDNGLGFTAGLNYVGENFSDRAQQIELPDVTLLNLGVFYEADKWEASLRVKNVTEERWFRGNFGTLFGQSTVLPQPDEAEYELSFAYTF